METESPSIDLAIKEYAYSREKAAFNELLTNKALRLRDLECKDLFALPDAEAQKVHKQIEYLTTELNVLYGFKVFTDLMERSYQESSERILKAYHERNLCLERELSTLSAAYAYLHYNYMATVDSLSFMTDLAMRLSEKLNNTKEIYKNGNS